MERLPPSAKLVFKVLEYGGLLTQKEIASETYLPPRTVRYALNRLRKEQLLEERFYFKDARQSLYGLKTNIPIQSAQKDSVDVEEQVLIQ
jgi:transcription initiation factor IIE alpha subunit